MLLQVLDILFSVRRWLQVFQIPPRESDLRCAEGGLQVNYKIAQDILRKHVVKSIEQVYKDTKVEKTCTFSISFFSLP